MHRIIQHVSLEELVRTSTGMLDELLALRVVIDSHGQRVKRLIDEMGAVTRDIRDVRAGRSDGSAEAVGALYSGADGLDAELTEAATRYADDLHTTLPRLRGSWERFMDIFLSYYSTKLLEERGEREEALRVRASLVEIRDSLDSSLEVLARPMIPVEETRDSVIDDHDWIAESERARVGLSEELSPILSSAIRAINILDVRLQSPEERAAVLRIPVSRVLAVRGGS